VFEGEAPVESEAVSEFGVLLLVCLPVCELDGVLPAELERDDEIVLVTLRVLEKLGVTDLVIVPVLVTVLEMVPV